VYGPNGEDVRPLDVHYIPSEEAQTLTVHARLAVLNAAAMPYMYHPPLHPPHWAELIENGLAAGGAFDPVKSRATVVETFDRASIRQAGFVDAKFQLSIAAVAPEFLRLMARQLLGSAMSRSGAGVSAAVRTVGLSIRGGLDGPSVVDATRLRAWIDDPTVQIAAFEGAAPFEFRVEQGEAWSLLVVPEKKLSTSVRDTIHTVARAWLSLSPMWPRSSDDPATSHVMAAPNLLEEQGARFDVIAPAAAKNERTRFPFAAAPAEAALRNAMRSLHARLPLRLAVLTRPPHESRGRVE
jgi:hypothetical protein